MIQQHNRFINQSVETLKQCLATLCQKHAPPAGTGHANNSSILSIHNSQHSTSMQQPAHRTSFPTSYRSSKLTLYLQPLLQDANMRIVNVCCVKGRGFGEVKGQSQRGFWSREVVQENQICLNWGHKLVEMERREKMKW